MQVCWSPHPRHSGFSTSSCRGNIDFLFLPLSAFVPDRPWQLFLVGSNEQLGDGTDAITGIKGIGTAKALQLVKAYGSVPDMLQNLDKIKDQQKKELIESNAEILERNLKLTSLRAGTSLPASRN